MLCALSQAETAPLPLKHFGPVSSYGTTSRWLCAIAFEKAKRMPVDHPRRVAIDGQKQLEEVFSYEIIIHCQKVFPHVSQLVDLFINPPWSISQGNWGLSWYLQTASVKQKMHYLLIFKTS